MKTLSLFALILLSSCTVNRTVISHADNVNIYHTKDINPKSKADKIRAKYFQVNPEFVHKDDAEQMHQESKKYIKSRIH